MIRFDYSKLQFLKVLFQTLLASSIFLLSSCGGAQVVETAAVSAQDQAQDTYQGVVELGAYVVRVVNEQAVEPYLSNNPMLPDNAEVGFTPKYVPLRLAVDSDGNLLISSSSSIVTDFGVIDIETSKTIISQENEHLLIIQINEQVAVYKLPPIGSDEAFKVDFSDNYSKYRILSFEQRASGNILLKLESFELNR